MMKAISGGRPLCAMLLGMALLTQPVMPALARDAAAAGAPAAAHQRLLPLEGGQNFRDLGGYVGAGGKTVRWGMLFRSGSMHWLTPADFAYLRGAGLRTVVDFRSTSERANEPVAWPETSWPNVISKEYEMDLGPMMEAFAAPDMDAAKAKAAMAHFYRDTPYRFADMYRRMFDQLKAQGAPLAFNCSAGKDRTGVAAALVLTVLGVDRETVIQDYLLSNRYFNPERVEKQPDPRTAAFFAKLPRDAIQALMGVDRSYIEAAFAEIESRPGGMNAYLRDELGLTALDMASLRARYLQ